MTNIEKIEDLINPNNKKNKVTAINHIVNNQLDLFTKAINDTEKHFNEIIINAEKESAELNRKLSLETYEKGILSEEDLKIYEDLGDYYYNYICPSSYNLTALAEMKIVYLFKSLEISMKSLIDIAYPKIKTDGFYKWENMDSFFKSKELKISDIQGYTDVYDLKKVNNRIKHRGEINDELKKIREFTDETELNSNNINLFYNRIKDKIEFFLKGIANMIINDLYTYDEKRLNEISDDLIQKMDKNTINQLIEILRKKMK